MISGPIHVMTFIQKDFEPSIREPTNTSQNPLQVCCIFETCTAGYCSNWFATKRWLESLKLFEWIHVVLKKTAPFMNVPRLFVGISECLKKSMAEAFLKMGCSSSAPTKMTAPQAAFTPKVHGLRNDGQQPQTRESLWEVKVYVAVFRM